MRVELGHGKGNLLDKEKLEDLIVLVQYWHVNWKLEGCFPSGIADFPANLVGLEHGLEASKWAEKKFLISPDT